MKEIPFNLNQSIKVKLTDLGIDIMKKERDELNKHIVSRGGKALGDYEVRVDQDGFTTFQLWGFIEQFGTHIGMCKESPIETNIKLLTKDMNELRLSPPPSIENRIKAAVVDDLHYHVVYYNRKEGASHAIRNIADGDKRITVLSIGSMERFYKERDVQFYNYNKRHIDGLQFDIVIADVVPEVKLKEFRCIYPHIKIVTLKSIQLLEV